MPRPLASVLSGLFFLGIAAVLSIPVVTSSAELVLRPQTYEGLVGETSTFTTAGSTSEVDATLDEGRVDAVPWAIHVNERGSTLCLAFRMGVVVPDDRTQGLLCTRPTGDEPGMSQFIPASEEYNRSVLVATLAGNISELRLRGTDDLPLEGAMYKLPSIFETDAIVLVVFLPSGTDLTSATATDVDGRNVDVSRLVDQVDAY